MAGYIGKTLPIATVTTTEPGLDLLEAETKQEQRDLLELGTASQSDVTTSATDTTAGRLLRVDDGVNKGSAQTITGVKTFSSNPISSASQSTATNALTRRDFVTGLDSANVKLTGNQTINGTKTFNGVINGTAVGIGTSSPEAQLEVVAPTSSGTDAGTLQLSSRWGFSQQVPGSSPVGTINFKSNYTGGGRGVWARIQAASDGTFSDSNQSRPTRLEFYTTPGGTAGALTERMRIDSSGKLLSPSGSAFVGTVSGIGNGAIMESGSNANGEFTKYANGLMICSIRGLTLPTSPIPYLLETTWTFPAEFASVDNLSTNMSIRNNAANLVGFTGWNDKQVRQRMTNSFANTTLTTTSVFIGQNFNQTVPNGATLTGVCATAIGRWK